MNAKKIMAAVLVALLAAALFVGAGAAANNGTVYINQNGVNTQDGIWKYGDYTVTIANGNVTSANFAEGTYVKGDDTLDILYPTAGFQFVGNTTGGHKYNAAPLYKGDALNVTLNQIATVGSFNISQIIVTYPNNAQKVIVPSTLTFDADDSIADVAVFTLEESKNLSTGTYKIQVQYKAEGDFSALVGPSSLIGSPVTFTVASSTADLSATVESVTIGDIIKLDVTGAPNGKYTITGLTNFVLKNGTFYNGTTTTYVNPQGNGIVHLTLPNDGKLSINLEANIEGTATIAIYDDHSTAPNTASVDKLKIKIVAGEATIKTDKDSYFIGETVKLVGTISGGVVDQNNFTIKGSNVDNFKIIVTDLNTNAGEWSAEWYSADKLGSPAKILDAGTYTITLTVGTEKASATVYLKQPFLTAEVTTPVVVQGSNLIVTGTAESAGTVAYYLFGNNKYVNGTVNVDTDDSTFELKLKLVDTNPANDKEVNLGVGEYFVVIQHPMYDKNFNIGPNPAVHGQIVMNITEDVSKATNVTVLINVDGRQTANAAEALCQALDTQNVDDMYVKGTFIVATPTASMNPVPAEITKGSKLVISGTSNYGEGETVTVELLSTRFAAVPKEDVNEAAFQAIITKTNADGTWSVEFDTSKLNIDEYTASATVGDFVATAKTNVIEGAPTEQPTENPTEQPTQTQQPTEAPTTPGFGALAALAGLGAVAVLLLRRE